MNRWTVAIRSLAFYRRSAAATAIGAAVGTAAIVGSLIVGNSVRLSLRESALERVGRAEFAVRSEAYFPEDLARRVAERPEFRAEFEACEPVIVLRGSARRASAVAEAAVGGGRETDPAASVVAQDRHGGAAGVSVVGVRNGFFAAMFGGEQPEPGDGQAAISATLAEDLGLSGGDELLVRVRRRGRGPAHTIFADRHRDEAVGTLRVTVAAVLPSKGAGAFSLQSGTLRVRNLFVSLPWLQRMLFLRGMANCLLISCGDDGRGVRRHTDARAARSVARIVGAAAEIADYGLEVFSVGRGAEARGVIHAREILLPASAVRAAFEAAASRGMRAKPASACLANSISPVRRGGATGGAGRVSKPAGDGGSGGEAGGDRGGSQAEAGAGAGASKRASVPYSVAVGIESPPGEIVAGSAGPIGDGEIVLNAWTAEALGARVGDAVEILYYSTGLNGVLSERTRRFTVRGIVAMRGDAIRRDFVPRIEGLTDADAVNEWKVPFPLDMSRIRPEDEDYWEKYRTAPKAYISLRAAADMWRPSGYGAAGRGAGAGVVEAEAEPGAGAGGTAADQTARPDTGVTAGAGAAGSGSSGAAWQESDAYAGWVTALDIRLAPRVRAAGKRNEAAEGGGSGGMPDGASGAGMAGGAGSSGENADWVTAWAGFLEEFRKRLDPEATGFSCRAVRAEALAAAEGSSDFGALFLAMNSFLMLSACLLTGLMFRLSVERRASQAGVLLAAGHTWASVAGMLWREGILIAACGCTAGVPVGAGYARLLIGGLGGIWSGAVGGEALAMRINWASAAIGWAAGFALSLTAMWWGMRPLRLAPVAHLLGGWKAMAARRRASGSPAYRPVRRFGGDRKAAAWAGLCAMAAGVVLAAVAPATGMLAEAAFFGAGALLLIGALALFRALLDRMRRGLSGGASVPDARDPEGRDVPSLAKMAIRSAALNPSRSVASVGLMACASFVLAAVSINWSGRGTDESLRPDSGTGGFVLVATTEISVPADIGSESGRRSLGIGGDAGGGPAGALQRAAVYSCRMSDGDEAGCLNARQPVVPRIIGVPASLIARGGFAFAEVADAFAGSSGPQVGGSGLPEGGGRVPIGGGSFPTGSGGLSDGSSESPAGNSKSAAGSGGPAGGSAGIPGGSAAPAPSPARTNPWRLLERRLPCGAIPAFADADSARWILKKGLGEEIAVPGVGGTVRLKLVGLISRSIFAGALVISEANFIEAFGDGGGYRYFLVEAPAEPGKYGRAEARDRDAAGTWAAAFRAELSRELERFGVETAPTSDVLAAYASVRDAYLSAFGALGGLALLLGALGTAVLTLRSVADWRGELAMMLAMGFSGRRMIGLVVLQNILPPAAGVAIGTAASIVAAVPYIARGVSGMAWLPAAFTIAVALALAVAVCFAAARRVPGGNLAEALRTE